MPAIWGAVISAGAGLYGANQQKKAANKANQMNWAALSEVLGTLGWWNSPTFQKDDWAYPIDTVFGRATQSFDKAKQYLNTGSQKLLAGYQNAAKEINQAGAGAQRAIMQGGQQSLAQGRMGLSQAGLMNSSLGAQLARANRSDTSQQITQLAGQLAPLRAQAQANIGEAAFRGRATLANFQQNRTQFETDLAMTRLNALLGQNIGTGPSWLEQIGGGAGLAALGNLGGHAISGIQNWFSGPSGAGAGHQGQAPTQQQYLNWWGQ